MCCMNAKGKINPNVRRYSSTFGIWFRRFHIIHFRFPTCASMNFRGKVFFFLHSTPGFQRMPRGSKTVSTP